MRQSRRSTYDTSGSVVSHTDADDNTTNYEYDALGRQVSETVAAAVHGNGYAHA